MNRNYISNYIAIAQINYPTVSRTPYDVLCHMLFTNGNGVEFDNDGDLVTYINNWVCYKAKDILGKPPEYYGSYDGPLRFIRERTDDRRTSEAYDALLFIESLPYEDAVSVQGLLSQMKDIKYRRNMSVSRGYFKGERICERTDKALQEVYLNMLIANLLYMSDDSLLDKKSVYSFRKTARQDTDHYQGEVEAKEIYKKEIERMLEIGFISEAHTKEVLEFLLTVNI